MSDNFTLGNTSSVLWEFSVNLFLDNLSLLAEIKTVQDHVFMPIECEKSRSGCKLKNQMLEKFPIILRKEHIFYVRAWRFLLTSPYSVCFSFNLEVSQPTLSFSGGYHMLMYSLSCDHYTFARARHSETQQNAIYEEGKCTLTSRDMGVSCPWTHFKWKAKLSVA